MGDGPARGDEVPLIEPTDPSFLGTGMGFLLDGAPSSMYVVSCVEMEETEDASSSPPLGTESKDVIVDDLFFRGNGGKTLPGISVRSLLCSLANSPYRLPI